MANIQDAAYNRHIGGSKMDADRFSGHQRQFLFHFKGMAVPHHVIWYQVAGNLGMMGRPESSAPTPAVPDKPSTTIFSISMIGSLTRGASPRIAAEAKQPDWQSDRPFDFIQMQFRDAVNGVSDQVPFCMLEAVNGLPDGPVAQTEGSAKVDHFTAHPDEFGGGIDRFAGRQGQKHHIAGSGILGLIRFTFTPYRLGWYKAISPRCGW